MFASYRWVVALTSLLAVTFAVSGWYQGGLDRRTLPLGLVLVAANTFPLLAVRRNPLLVTVCFSVAYPAYIELGFPDHELQSLPALAALYFLGRWDRPLWLRALGLHLPVWMVVGGTLAWGGDALELGYIAIVFVVVWALGVVVAQRRADARRLQLRTEELQAARRELADRAVADERARIARELHDVIAHAMSVITVQAGVGGHLIDREPRRAAEALGVIERIGRETLAEMRRLLAVLREPDPRGPSPRPQPGLADLPQLFEQVGDAGVSVHHSVRGSGRQTTPGLELAIYRVVQEALTNVIKHAPHARASVTVSHRSDGIEVEITNPTPNGRATPDVVPGQGIRGMAERVALYGGQLRTVADDGTFRVTASFPQEDTA